MSIYAGRRFYPLSLAARLVGDLIANQKEFSKILPNDNKNDSLGVALSCDKPLCSSGNHHPLCNLPNEAD